MGLGRIGYVVVRWFIGFDMGIVYLGIWFKDNVLDWVFIVDLIVLVEWLDFLIVMFVVFVVMWYIVNKVVIDVVGLDGMIINISWVLNIDEFVLLDVLEIGCFGFVVLDVFENEFVFNLWFLELNNVLF